MENDNDLIVGKYYYLKPKSFGLGFWLWIAFVIIGTGNLTWLLIKNIFL